MPRHRAPGRLVADERVPERQQRPGERGDEDRVVDVAHDADCAAGSTTRSGATDAGDAVRDSSCRRPSPARGRPPARRRRSRRGAAAPAWLRPPTRDGHRHVGGRGREEAAPARVPAASSRLPRVRRRQQHAGQHPDPARRRRSRCRASPAAASRAAAATARCAADPVLDAGGPVQPGQGRRRRVGGMAHVHALPISQGGMMPGWPEVSQSGSTSAAPRWRPVWSTRARSSTRYAGTPPPQPDGDRGHDRRDAPSWSRATTSTRWASAPPASSTRRGRTVLFSPHLSWRQRAAA